ncbi:MAG TPA: type II toxin-antitoxin system VapC family toxin [Stellaceae bacterium]|nr:type II toxin-antitoxin system VapC family toxin [Stellaceae bacterium]
MDTHALVWWLNDSPRLSSSAKAAMRDSANDLLVSAIVAYEIAYKERSGRMPLIAANLPRQLRHERIGILPITLDHALAAAALSGPHRDPWDRIMIAQAQAEQLSVVTVDHVFSDYGVPVVW